MATQIAANVAVNLKRADDVTVALAATLTDEGDGMSNRELGRWFAGVSAHHRYPGLLGVSFIAYVRAPGLERFLRHLRADPPPGVRPGPIHIFPPEQRSHYCLMRDSAVRGLNRIGVAPGIPAGVLLDVCGIGGEPILAAARDSGQLNAVVINLPTVGRVLNLSVPVYSETPPPGSVAQRRARIVGWALAQISLRGFLANALLGTRRVSVTVYRPDSLAETWRSSSALGPITAVARSGQAGPGDLQQTSDVNADGRWLVTVSGPPQSSGVAADVQGLFVFGVGALVAVLVWLVMTLLTRTRVKAEDRLRAILTHSPAAIFITDRKGRYVATNEAYDRLFGIEPGSAISRSLEEVLPADLAAEARSTASRVLAGETVRKVLTVGASADCQTISLLKFPLVGKDGAAYAICGIVDDVTATRRLEERLQHLSHFDSLTGVYNRGRLIEELDRRLRYAAQYGHQGVVLTFNVDHLRVINDTYGPSAGDMVLKALADELQCRTGGADIVARLGGDEFTIVLSEGTEAGALTLARDVRSALCERAVGSPINVSIGIATFTSEDELSADELLVCADVAVSEAKEAGGDSVKIYTGEGGGMMTWAQRIRAALAEDRFVLYGQPIVSLRDGTVTHHELLIRMLSEDGDIIPPVAFLPTAERFGLIGEIDRWVVQEGLRLARQEGGVAINLSAHSIGDRNVIWETRKAVAHGLDPATVIFEVTETAATRNLHGARLFAGMLNGIGCSVALDDFGTGFASLMYLKNIPAQYIKIDVEFVSRLTEDTTDRLIVQSIVAMARALGKRTVAEGVENHETLVALRALGVDFAQGYHLGRPKRLSPPTAFERGLSTTGELHSEAASHVAAGAQPSRSLG